MMDMWKGPYFHSKLPHKYVTKLKNTCDIVKYTTI